MDTMRNGMRWAIVLTMAALCAALLGGCGSKTKTVSVAATPAVPQTTGAVAPTTTSTGASTTPPASTTQTQASTNGGTAAPTTRSAPEPEFAQQEAGPEGLSAAVAVVRAKGYTPNDTSVYHPSQTLRVLIGTRNRSAGAFDEQAFFFVNGHFIGTDSSRPSATLSVVGQGDTEVTLAYPLYRSADHVCCPSGGRARVRFQLDNGRLAALDPIPPATSSSGFSRQ
jgi:hypothetical protein